MGVSATLITRDEEEHLGDCLSSLRGLVDEIVVVDTGSRDATPDIARRCGARLHHERWRDDFAQARNVALSLAREDWILYIDADERLVSTEPLAPMLGDAGAIAATVSFRARSDLTPYREHRLFRNREDVRFRGVIHETILPDLLALQAKEGGSIPHLPVGVEHYGYEGDLSHKHRRNLPLLLRQIEHDPDRIYLYHALGEAQLGLGDEASALATWQRARDRLLRRSPEPGDALIFSHLLMLADSAGDDGLRSAHALIDEAWSRHPNDPLILWWRARHLVANDEPGRAVAPLERLLAIDPERPPTGAIGYDLRLFAELPRALLGVCRVQLGETDDGVRLLREAEALAPDNLEIRTKRMLAEARAQSTSTGRGSP